MNPSVTTAGLLAALYFCFPSSLSAQESKDEGAGQTVLSEKEREEKILQLMKRDLSECVVFVPKFERPPVFIPVKGAKSTGMAACRQETGGLTFISRKEFRKLGLSWAEFVQKSLPHCEELLDLLVPIYQRDENGVISFGQLISEHPLTATIILSPQFFDRFEETMGVGFYVAIPDRKTIVMLPKTSKTFSGSQERIAQRLAEIYQMASFPASMELFEVSKTGIRAVAEIPEI